MRPNASTVCGARGRGTMRRVALACLFWMVHGGQGFLAPPMPQAWRVHCLFSTRPTRREGIIAQGSRLGVGRRSASTLSRLGGVSMSVKDMLGADVESGGLFDPLGFSRDEPALFRRRAVELKHGRIVIFAPCSIGQVSMLAIVGIIVQSFVRFPGFPPFFVTNPARPLAVLKGLWVSERNALLLVLLAIGFVDLTIGRQDYVERAPGELGEFGTFAKPVDEEEWEKVQMAELKHGRLAMLAVVGALVQEMVTGQGPVEQLWNGNINPFR